MYLRLGLRELFMKKLLFCLTLTFAVSYSAFADSSAAIRNYPVQQKSAIQSPSSRILYTNAKNINVKDDSLMPAIKEIQNKIAQNSNDYFLYASLVDLYIKSGMYDKAYDELIFLSNLASKNMLEANTMQKLNNIYQMNKANTKYITADKGLLYLDMALLASIGNDTLKASDYISYAYDYKENQDKTDNSLRIIFNKTANVQKSVELCDKILLKNPNNANVLKQKAEFLMQMNMAKEACDTYLNVLALKPDDTEAKYYIFKYLNEKGASEKEIFRKIYKTDKPDYEKAYYEIADILLKRDDNNTAIKYAQILVNKYPENANGYILLSEIYKKEGKLKESYEALEKVRDKADSNEAVAKYNVMLAKLSNEPLKEANSLIMNGLYSQALEVLDSADQGNLYVILTQARANYLLNNKENTFDLLNKAMSLFPENSDVYCAFGYIYLQEKDIDTARKYTNKSLKINPENKTALDLLDMVNQAETDKMMNNIITSYESQNYTETMRLIDEALEINKKDSDLYFYKALTYIAQNNYAASTASLYKCIELDKNNKQAYFYLASAFDNLSEPENALINYKKFINLLSDDDYGESEKRNYAMYRIKKLSEK